MEDIKVGDYVEFLSESPFYHPAPYKWRYNRGDWARVNNIAPDGRPLIQGHHGCEPVGPDLVRKRSKPLVLRPSTYAIPIAMGILTTAGFFSGRRIMNSTFANELLSDPLVMKSLTGLIATLGLSGSAAAVILLVKWVLGSMARGIGTVRTAAERREDRRRTLRIADEEHRKELTREEAADKHDELLQLVRSVVPATIKSLTPRPGAVVRFHKNTHGTTLNGADIKPGNVAVLGVVNPNNTNSCQLVGGNWADASDFEVIA